MLFCCHLSDLLQYFDVPEGVWVEGSKTMPQGRHASRRVSVGAEFVDELPPQALGLQREGG